MARAPRLQLTDAYARGALQASPSQDQVRLLRACNVVIILYLFFSSGGSGIDNLTKDLVAYAEDRI
jgi:hypothetical protein